MCIACNNDTCIHVCTIVKLITVFIKTIVSHDAFQNASCPAQPCLNPSQLRDAFSACSRKMPCQIANTSLVLLPGTYTTGPNGASLFPVTKYFSLSSYVDCADNTQPTAIIDCHGGSMSLTFQHIKCVQVNNCLVLAGPGSRVAIENAVFNDTMIRMTSSEADNSTDQHNYTPGSQEYCLYQKQLSDDISIQTSSELVLWNVSFSSYYLSKCSQSHSIRLTTIIIIGSFLDIANCTFSQELLTHISLSDSTLHATGATHFELGNTAIEADNSTISITGDVKFNGQKACAISSGTHTTINIAGRVNFINNSAFYGAAIYLNTDSYLTIADYAEVIFCGNRAWYVGGAIYTVQSISLGGRVQFIENTAHSGGAVYSGEYLTITKNARVEFQGNYANDQGGAIYSKNNVTIEGMVKFLDNSANTGGAIFSEDSIETITGDTLFQDNHSDGDGGAIWSKHVALDGVVQFLNNTSLLSGGAILSLEDTIVYEHAQVVFQDNHAYSRGGGAISSYQSTTLGGLGKFINNTSGGNGGAVYSNVATTMDHAQIMFQGNHAKEDGGAIASFVSITLAGTVCFVSNSAQIGGATISYGTATLNGANITFQDNFALALGGAIASFEEFIVSSAATFSNNTAMQQGGAVYSAGDISVLDNAQLIFQGNHATGEGGAVLSSEYITLSGTVCFISNSATSGGAVAAYAGMSIPERADVTFQDNFALKSAGGGIVCFGQFIVTGRVTFNNNRANDRGAAVSILGAATILENAQVIFKDNRASNQGGAIYSSQSITLKGTCMVRFINNSADFGGALALQGSDRDMSITIANDAEVLFEDNHADTNGGAISSFLNVVIQDARVTFQGNTAENGAGAVLCFWSVIVNSTQVVFRDNSALYGGAIVTQQQLQLTGNVKFVNNTALVTGGALYCSEASVAMRVSNYTHVTFIGNHAEYIGGAIYFKPAGGVATFFQAYSNDLVGIWYELHSRIYLINNTAKHGGSAVYGTQTRTKFCNHLEDTHSYSSAALALYGDLYDIFTITPDDSSAVSSDPLRVCICPDQSTPDCLAILPEQNISYLHYTVYPGQAFYIPATVVAYNFALTIGSVHATFLNSDASFALDSQYVQAVSNTGCLQLQYSVLSTNKQETLVLTTNAKRVINSIDNSIAKGIETQNSNMFNSSFCDGFNISIPNKYYRNDTFVTNLTDGVFRLTGHVEDSLQGAPIFISLTLLDCPLGFSFSDKFRKCECNERIVKNNLTCNITHQTVHRHTTLWVNASFSGNTSNGVIVHKHCPFEYCKPQQQDINLLAPDSQCAYNRHGTLCGACKPGLSLVLGSSQCLEDCSNRYLSLLITFASAGFALVFFINVLNLTVSQGTVNGLIFYANIVAANQSIFFPVEFNKFLSFLSVFISWLNLDLGIETCFIKGLDAYWKTWLQFLFPFYVWAIAGAIIIASRYSTRATKIFGKNSVPVLATLFLLSYGKLLRSIITTFSFTFIVHPDNFTSAVWALDGNVPYFSPKHTPLLLFCFVCVLLLWLPYTAVLLSAQWLRTQTHRKYLRWLKPFLDAYYGPFKEKHHYWVGVLLVVRGVLYICFAIFFAIENDVNLLLISITCGLVFMYVTIPGRLYAKVHLSFLENSFFLNLGVLAAGTFYIRLVGGSQEALVTTSIGTVFLEFIAIVLFHFYQFVIKPNQQCLTTALYRTFYTSANAEEELLLGTDEAAQPLTPVVTHSEVSLSELRAEAGSAHQHDLPNPTPPPVLPLHQRAEYINGTLGVGNNTLGSLQISPNLPLGGASADNRNDDSRVQIVDNTSVMQAVRSSPTATGHHGTNSKDESSKLEERLADRAPPPEPLPSEEEIRSEPRYYAASRDYRFVDFIAPRETLLEYTEYHLLEERGHADQRSPAAAAKREDSIDFTAARESLLEPTQ